MTPGPRGRAIFDSRGMAGRIYQEDHYTLLHTKYKSSGPCVFGEEDFFYVFSHDAPGLTVSRIYKEDHYILLHTKYESCGPPGFGEEDFLCFSDDAPRAGPVWTPGAQLAGFIKMTTIHCYSYTQNMKALSLVVSEKKIFFMFFPLYVYGS